MPFEQIGDEPLDKFVKARLTLSERVLVEARCAELGMNISEYLRESATGRITFEERNLASDRYVELMHRAFNSLSSARGQLMHAHNHFGGIYGIQTAEAINDLRTFGQQLPVLNFPISAKKTKIKRPAESLGRRKNPTAGGRVTQSEYISIEKKSKQYGLSVSDFIRATAAGRIILIDVDADTNSITEQAHKAFSLFNIARSHLMDLIEKLEAPDSGKIVPSIYQIRLRAKEMVDAILAGAVAS